MYPLMADSHLANRHMTFIRILFRIFSSFVVTNTLLVIYTFVNTGHIRV